MTERTGARLVKLFDINIRHHYWLDDGLTLFEQLPKTVQDARLRNYDVRNFIGLAATQDTKRLLRAFGCLAINTASGISVLAPISATIPGDTAWTWQIIPKHQDFYNYTAFTLRKQTLFRLYHPDENKMYRYKENVALLSNMTGTTRGPANNKTLYLSQEFPALKPDDKIESIVKVGIALNQLTSDQPGAVSKKIHPQANSSPVFMHQGDIPAITPPPGLTGAPPKGILLTDELDEKLFALIQITATRLDNSAFSVIDASGRPKQTPLSPPTFEIHLKNRATIWRYIGKTDGALKSEETDPLPLTHFGNAAVTKPKPSEGFPKVITDKTRIIRLESDIFI